MPEIAHIPDAIAAGALSVALIGPDSRSRKQIADELAGWGNGRVREFSFYPSVLNELPAMLAENYDIVIVDLETDPQHALDVVEGICTSGSTTVMVYSAGVDPVMVVRCMQAGAREFLELPLERGVLGEALVRAAARHKGSTTPQKALGKSLVFLGAKGGSGATTVACNFAVSLALESKQSTLLIDLELPFGDAALNLGIAGDYSTIDALRDSERLDPRLLSSLLVKHSSGLSVLAAPGRFVDFKVLNGAIDKLMSVARRNFDNVVVDAGSSLDLTDSALFREASMTYMVMQFAVPELRNANRLVSQMFPVNGPKLEIVLNRFTPNSHGADEGQIEKALGRPVKWRVPNDYAAVRHMQDTAVPLVMKDSEIARVIQQMARTECGLPTEPEKKKKGFSFFR